MKRLPKETLLLWMLISPRRLYAAETTTTFLDDVSTALRNIQASGVMRALKQPFFALGEMQLSIWLLVKAGILLWLFLLLANAINRFLDRKVYPNLKLDEGVHFTIATVVKYLMFVIGLFTVVNLLGINFGGFAVFAGTIGIGIGFGLQDVAKNFISGLVILAERPVKVGDYIEVGDLPGRVRAIKARSTVVDTFDNVAVVVPNSEFISSRVINWSYSDRVIRVSPSVGVAYGSNLEVVKKCLIEAGSSHPKVLKRPEPSVWFEGFGESSLDFKLHCWIKEPQNRMGIKSDINFEIDRLFRANGVTIPFPQRDLHLKSSEVNLT